MTSGPFFIFGAPRSGTSLLSRILNAHSRLGVPYESRLYQSLYGWRDHYGDLSITANRERLVTHMLATHHLRCWSRRPSVGAILANFDRHDFHGAFAALMKSWAETQGKARWGEKTPQHLEYWRELAQAFPDAKFINIVRDGRDVALSYRAAPFGPRDFLSLAQRWRRSIETAESCRDAIGPDRFLEVRYERLLADQAGVAAQASEFLGERFEPVMLEFHRRPERYPTDAWNERNLARPVIALNAGRWRSALSAGQLRIFEATAGDALERLHYDRALPDAVVSRAETLWRRRVVAPWQRLLGMAANRAGQIEAARRWRIRARLWVSRPIAR